MWTLFYRNSRLLILTICLILIVGISSWQLIPRMEDPALSQWYGFVLTAYPGASAQRVESLVTEKIEQELLTIDSVETIRSTSSIGNSFIVINIKNTVKDFEQVWSEVRDRLANVTPQLPQGALAPEYQEVSPRAYTLIVALTWELESPANYAVLRRLAEKLQNELRLIPGTEDVDLVSEPFEEIVVAINPTHLVALNLSPPELSQQIQLSDAKVAAGQLRETDNELLLEIESELDSLQRIRQIPIRSGNPGQVAYLGDIASVTKGIREPPPELAIINGKPGVTLAVRMEADQRIEQWTTRAHQTLQQFRQRHPAGIELEIVLEQSRYVAHRLNSLFKNLLLGIVFVFVSTLMMMGWRSALVVGAALPLSILMVLGSMQILGIPLHQISVTGMVIALGMVIDNPIVIVDEIQHQLKQGMPIQTAISQGVNYLVIPLLSSNLTTILTFVPILLLPGDAGEFVGTVALSVILALLSSLSLSLTIIPALLGRMVSKAPQARNSNKKSLRNWSFSLGKTRRFRRVRNTRPNQNTFWNQGFSHPRLSRIYGVTLDFILAKPILGILLALILPITGFLMATSLPEQFFPLATRDQFHIELELSPSASLEKTQGVAQDARTIILNHPEVTNVHWFLGNEAPEFYYNLPRRSESRSNYAHGIVQLTSENHLTHLVKTLQNELNQALPSVRVLVRRLEQGPYIAAPIELRLYGSDLQVLRRLGKQIRLILAQVDGMTYTRASLSDALPKLALRLDEAHTKLTGLDNTSIAEQLNTSLEGGLGGSILEDTEELPVRVRLSDRDRSDLDQIKTLDLLPKNIAENRSPIPLAAVGEIDIVPELSKITRRNGQRVNRIQGFIVPDILPAIVLEEFQQKFSSIDFQLPPGYSLEIGGESAERDKTVASLMSIVSVLLVVMLATLVLSFNSFRAAAIITLVGICSIGLGLFSLWCFRYPIGFMAILGTVGLIGVAINDSIVVLAALRAQPTAYQGNPQAIKGVVLRSTRHVLTTTVTTVAGFMPLLFSGSDFWAPLAICVVGGIGGATLLALYFVPCIVMYTFKYRSH
ncbi:MAG: efflux RND transporter permease subunit [Leptolyngbya sp. SIO3F4]|nr:efflux RND transporter permease subunit [Leptolyngbya sp. SIO3F4]